jgi:hypothetical protein
MSINDDKLAIILNQSEMKYLLGLMGAKSLVGINPALLAGKAPSAGRKSLASRNLIQPGLSGGNDLIEGGLLHTIIPLMFPERAMIVIRTIPKTGMQTLVFLHRDQTTVLHTMPKENTHRLIELASPEEGIRALVEWFPFQNYPGSAVNMIIPSKSLDQFKAYAVTGLDELALQAIKTAKVPVAEKRLLLQTVKEIAISGSFALLNVVGNQVTSAESLAVIANQTTAWAVTSPDVSDPATVLIRRTGGDLPLIFTNMFTWLTGKPAG